MSSQSNPRPKNDEDPGKPAGQPGSICAPVGIRTPNLLIRREQVLRGKRAPTAQINAAAHAHRRISGYIDAPSCPHSVPKRTGIPTVSSELGAVLRRLSKPMAHRLPLVQFADQAGYAGALVRALETAASQSLARWCVSVRCRAVEVTCSEPAHRHIDAHDDAVRSFS